MSERMTKKPELTEAMTCPRCARISQLLGASVLGGVHFAVEPELSSVDIHFAKRDEAGEMSELLCDIHPLDEEGCFIHRAPLPARTPPGTEPSEAVELLTSLRRLCQSSSQPLYVEILNEALEALETQHTAKDARIAELEEGLAQIAEMPKAGWMIARALINKDRDAG